MSSNSSSEALSKAFHRRSASGAVLALAVAAVIGAFIGAGLTRLSRHDMPAARAASQPPGERSTSGEEWLARLSTASWKDLGTSDRQEWTHAAAQSKPLRAELIRRYAKERDKDEGIALRDALAEISTPDVVAAALQLADSSTAAERAAGLRLLVRFPPNLKAYEIARRLLPVERDPAVLAGALMNLRPEELPSSSESRAMVAQIVSFIHHADPMVRAHSIQMLAEWDKEGAVAAPAVLEALSAPDPLVRQAAVGAVMVGQLRSEALKKAMVKLLSRPGEDIVTKGGVLQALERFPLSDEEHAVFLSTQRELERASSPEPPPGDSRQVSAAREGPSGPR